MKNVFNDNLEAENFRAVPPPAVGLEDRIIAAALTKGLPGEPFYMMILLPRPLMIMSVLFVLSLFVGIEVDLGFNVPEDMIVQERDILVFFDEESL
jgi:hypothetical protein